MACLSRPGAGAGKDQARVEHRPGRRDWARAQAAGTGHAPKPPSGAAALILRRRCDVKTKNLEIPGHVPVHVLGAGTGDRVDDVEARLEEARPKGEARRVLESLLVFVEAAAAEEERVAAAAPLAPQPRRRRRQRLVVFARLRDVSRPASALSRRRLGAPYAIDAKEGRRAGTSLTASSYCRIRLTLRNTSRPYASVRPSSQSHCRALAAMTVIASSLMASMISSFSAGDRGAVMPLSRRQFSTPAQNAAEPGGQWRASSRRRRISRSMSPTTPTLMARRSEASESESESDSPEDDAEARSGKLVSEAELAERRSGGMRGMFRGWGPLWSAATSRSRSRIPSSPSTSE